MPINIDWVELLRSQQADFIQRLKSRNLLHSEIPGQHSELTVVSGERLKQIRKFCWRMANKYKQNSDVEAVFINNLKGKLGEEVVKARLSDFVTEVDYEQKIGGDGKVDFTLAADSSVGIQVKARHSAIDRVQWSISSEEIQKNIVLVCVLIQEEVNEAQTEYHLVLSGFIPTESVKLNNGQASVSINELMYSGGLKSYLESVLLNKTFSNKADIQKPLYQNVLPAITSTLTIGSWQYTLPLNSEDLVNIEEAIKQLKEAQTVINTQPQTHQSLLESFFNDSKKLTASEIWKKVTQDLLIEETELDILWNAVIQNINSSAIKAFFSQHCHLINITSNFATIGISSQPLLKLALERLSNIETAFIKEFSCKVKFNIIIQPRT